MSTAIKKREEHAAKITKNSSKDIIEVKAKKEVISQSGEKGNLF